MHMRQTRSNPVDAQLLFPRQNNSSYPGGRVEYCVTREATGECRYPDKCPGIVYSRDSEAALCYGYGFPQEVKCCLISECTVPEGRGICRRSDNGCEGGRFIVGTRDPVTKKWPCIGGDDITCCVKNGTNVTYAVPSTLPRTSTIIPDSSSSKPDSTFDGTGIKNEKPASDSNTIKAAVGGVVGSMLAFALILGIFLLFRKWRERGTLKWGSTKHPSVGELRGQSIQNSLQDPGKEVNPNAGGDQVNARLTRQMTYEIDGKEKHPAGCASNNVTDVNANMASESDPGTELRDNRVMATKGAGVFYELEGTTGKDTEDLKDVSSSGGSGVTPSTNS